MLDPTPAAGSAPRHGQKTLEHGSELTAPPNVTPFGQAPDGQGSPGPGPESKTGSQTGSQTEASRAAITTPSRTCAPSPTLPPASAAPVRGAGAPSKPCAPSADAVRPDHPGAARAAPSMPGQGPMADTRLDQPTGGPAGDRSLRLRTARDRRGFRRVDLPLSGRLLDPFGAEHPFDLINISPGGLALRSPARWRVGARAVIYCNGLGRLVGEIVRGDAASFAVRFELTPLKQDRLADEITWLWNKDRLNLSDERSFARAQVNGRVGVRLDDGRELDCDIVDMSLFGVSLACTQARPFIGQEAVLAGRRCRVARYTDAGFALDFRTGLAPGDAR
jgi:hypothetical protein